MTSLPRVPDELVAAYEDVLTPRALAALAAVAPFEAERRELMAERSARRRRRAATGERIDFLPADGLVPGTAIRVADARAGRFIGAPIPVDLERQWIQGTGPAARPDGPPEAGLRNVAYALLSGADGWMFDGEDALGQVGTMSLASQRNLRRAFAFDPAFLAVAEGVASEMNAWAAGFFGRPIVGDWRAQLEATTRIFRVRGLHLEDRHVRLADGSGLSASLVDLVLYVVANHATLRAQGRSLVLYLPKIETAGDAALWARVLDALEDDLTLPRGSIRVYVLVERLEAAFQLMEIRAALGLHFVGYNTGRWDYINSVADALAWDPAFVNPNIDAIAMTYGYMRNYEDRVRRAVNMPDAAGGFALWQGGMEPNIPVGSPAGVEAAMARAIAGAEREERAGASGKWVAHWKMVHIVRPVWERVGRPNQLGRSFPPLTYSPEDGAALELLEPAPRTVRGARDLLSVALQYGNAFLQGYQAAALKPADFFADDSVLYLMEDMATGEIRLSILWEWLHKGARLTASDAASGLREGDPVDADLVARLLSEEQGKLLAANDRDVHDDSKATTLPIARDIVAAYLAEPSKLPWYIDLLNVCLDAASPAEARDRVAAYLAAFRADGTRPGPSPTRLPAPGTSETAA